MGTIIINNLPENTAPTDETNFIVGGGKGQKMKLSTLFSWIGKKEQDQWVDIDVASCMAAAGHEEIYYPYKGYPRFNTAT